MRIAIPKLDIVASGLFLLFGVYVLFQAVEFGITSDTGPGSGTFPLVAGVFITFFSAMNLVRTVRSVRIEGQAAGPGEARPEPEGMWIGMPELLRVAGIVLLVSIYLWLFPALGPFLALPFLMVGISLIIHWRVDPKWLLQIAAISVALTVACYFIFEVFLRILLPEGLLGF